MQSFQRAFPLFSIVVAASFLLGCGGPGTPVPGSSDPAEEAANAALAPEDAPAAAGESAAQATPAEATESKSAKKPASEDAKAASAPESGS